MENYLMINGKKIELTEEQVKILSNEEEKKDIWDPKVGEMYYFIENRNEINSYFWEGDVTDISFKTAANCCTDESIMQKRALQETLSRLLWRFSLQNGWKDDLWKNRTIGKFYIFYNIEETYDVSCDFTTRCQGIVYFVSTEVAKRAIDEIIKPFIEKHPELMENNTDKF